MLTRSGKGRERPQRSSEDEESEDSKENPLYQEDTTCSTSASTPRSQKTTPSRPVTRKLTDFWLIGYPSTSINGTKLSDCQVSDVKSLASHVTSTNWVSLERGSIVEYFSLAMDRGVVTCILPDLFAAFDTVDHSILLSRLHNWFGFDGLSLNWSSSHLSSRFFRQSQSMIQSLHSLLFPVVYPKVPLLAHCFLLSILFLLVR